MKAKQSSANLRAALVCAACLASASCFSPAYAILSMHNMASPYENPLVTNIEYRRYENLANQARYANVGQLRLSYEGDMYSRDSCSGTLISLNVVLTAAHCLYDKQGNTRFDISSGSATTGYGMKPGEQMAFWTGPQIGKNISAGYPTTNYTYAAYVDRVLPNAAYVGTGPGGQASDIALLRLSTSAPSRGVLPTTFPTLSDSYADVSGPTPLLANAVGYGMWGTGITFEKDNPAAVKRAGIVDLMPSSLNTPLLAAQFYTPIQLAAKQFPSNFLQGALAPGDSGGPLFYNFGPNPGRLVGVANAVYTVGPSGDSFGYGQTSLWTAVAPHAAWLDSAEPTLAAAGAFLIAGLDAANPITPLSVSFSPTETAARFSLSVIDPGIAMFVDPVIGEMAEIHVGDGPLLRSLLLPASYGFNPRVLVYDEAAGSFMDTSLTAVAGEWLDLPDPTTAIRLLGDGSTDELVVGFRFNSAGPADLLWVTAVPEIPSNAMLLLGLLLLWPLRKAARYRKPLD